MQVVGFCWICIVLAVPALAQTNPVPFVNQPVLPTSVAPGGAGFTLTVNGSGFVSGATVNWNGSPRATTFVSVTQLTAAILATDIANPTTAIITVTNPAPGGGISNYVYLSVTNPISAVAFARNDISIGPVGGGYGTESTAISNIVSADFNGDGKLDIAAGVADGVQALSTFYSTPEICVYLGTGSVSFESPECYALPTQLFPENPGFAYPCQALAADVDGDGKIDLLCNSSNPFYPNGITVFFGNGDGTFQTPGKATQYNSANTLEGIAGIGDFNHDGKLDLVAVDYGATTLALGNGDGTFAAPVTI
jgi:hypothetical protein